MKKRDISNTMKRLDEIPLPDKEKIMSACKKAEAFPDTENQTILHVKTVRTIKHRLKLKSLVAACAAFVVMLAGVSVYTVSADAKEYNKAIAFFEENDLPTDGLSRSDIMNVYKDITAGSFTYEKTAEVIIKSISGSTVSGYEIFQDEPTPEDIENLWNYKNNWGDYLINNPGNTESGITYNFRYDCKMNEMLGFETLEKSVFEKYIDGNLIWGVEFSDFFFEGYFVINDNVIVYGETSTYSSEQNTYAWIAMIGSDGTILWEIKMDNGFKHEYISKVLPGSNSIAVFSRGDFTNLCLSEYDMNGNLTNFHKNEVGNYGIWNAARLGDGYIVQLGSYITGEYSRIVKIDSDGSITDTFTYESDDCYYFITDMIEYNGKIYLSAHTVPVLENEEENAGGRYDIAAILDYIYNGHMDISNEELTELIREHFTAVLLICDADSFAPDEFYTVKGSLGGKLALDEEGNLLWDVESISDTFYSPMTSSFTIGGKSYVYRYTFDKNGTILNQKKTGEVADFRR
ncbi:MAG: hypothetical protein PHW77_03275 [Eubacteriales bacterium]|nr:hypothetical protein [Eubacteriales bacterium]